MKIKATILTLFLTLIAVQGAYADLVYVKSGAPIGTGLCDAPANACTLDQAKLDAINPGDTIIIILGSHSFGPLDIKKDFVTIQGPTVLGTAAACAPATDACLTATGAYLFGIAADNVIIENVSIAGTTGVTWTGILVKPHVADTDKRDRWTIRNSRIINIDAKKPAAPNNTRNHSYGIYAESRETTGTATFTGNEIFNNYFSDLGGKTLVGANRTAGMAIYVEGISGDVTKCTTALKFQCGLWVHKNLFGNLFIGQNSLNFGIDVNGKEPSVGITVTQDANNALPNSGALIGGTAVGTDVNTYFPATGHPTPTANGLMTSAVVMNVGGSRVEETNTSLGGLAGVEAYVVNQNRKATVNELAITPFFKSLDPLVFGPGSDAYFSTEALALANTSATGNIVSLTAGPAHLMTVNARGSSVSYKVSKDAGGNLEVRSGAQLLYDGKFWTPAPVVAGVDKLVLGGTAGNDLLTVDFDNGNSIPWGGDGAATNGIAFDGLGGFDAITIRGSAQSTNETIQMEDSDSGWILFEPVAGADLALNGFTSGTTRSIKFDNLEPIDDVVIVNGAYAIIAQDDVDAEINVINGPFKYGFKTFQVNSGATKTFEEVNFANKKHLHVYGSDDTVAPGNGDDILSIFTNDADTPPLLIDIALYGGDKAANADLSDDKFVIRPSANFPISASGGATQTDMIFLDCANTNIDASCSPSKITGLFPAVVDNVPIATAGITGAQPVTYSLMESTALALNVAPLNVATDVNIDKVAIGWAANGAHPGDELTYTVTITNAAAPAINTTTQPIYVTDLIDHRLSLVEQSVVVTKGSVDITGNRSMLWRIDGDAAFVQNETATLTYKVIVNTLITTVNIDNWASILNQDASVTQWVTGAPLEHYAKNSLDVLDVFGFPLKAAINSSLFIETAAGPRYIVGLQGGAKDPAQAGLGAVLCRVPSTNQAAGWDGGLGNLWYSCGKNLPNIGGIPLPLIVTDLFQDSAGRIWLTTWGNEGLFYSDDGAQTWVNANLDISGGQGGSPDGVPDGLAQVYAITEDILGTLFISANNGDVYRSFDRGVTWQKAKQLPMGSADTAFSMVADPTLPGKLYAGTFGDGLYVTNDFGETWSKPTGTGLASGYIFDIEFDPFSGNLFVGTANGLYYSADGGNNWNNLNSAFPVPSHSPEVRNIAFDQNGALFASTWGQGVWSSLDWQAAAMSLFALKATNVMNVSVSNNTVFALLEDGTVTTFRYEGSARSTGTEDLDSSELPGEFILSQNYPNPFNPTTSIEFSLPQSSNINLTVYDVVGRQIAVLINGQMASGRHSVTFNASNLPSGMYLYRLTTPTGFITQKMILMK